jgi:hypothetical protein
MQVEADYGTCQECGDPYGLSFAQYGTTYDEVKEEWVYGAVIGTDVYCESCASRAGRRYM